MVDFNPHPFIGRRRELQLLDELDTKRPGAKFLVVYGRRRIGKTRLLTHWAEMRGKPLLYWMATETSPANLLASFSQRVRKFGDPEAQVDFTFTYPNWEVVFEEVARIAQEKPFVLIIDEFTYATAAVKELASELQKAWDHIFKKTSLFLIISGSQVHMMMKQIHSSQAPLYGRATARIHLLPLPYSALPEFFPKYEPDALVALMAIFGGIPAYLEMFDPNDSLTENIRNVLLRPNTLLQSEALLLLHEQFDEPRNYVSIMQAIAHNHRTRKEIADYTGLPADNVGSYLNTLVELNFVERRIPITSKPTKDVRKGRYYLLDAYLRFYFRFIAPQLHLIESYRAQEALDYVREQLRAFVGEHAFEYLCRDWVGFMGDKKRIPVSPQRIGGFWSKDAQLDVFALNERKKQVLIGECKWGADFVDVDVVQKLLVQAPKGVAELKESSAWKSHLYLFVRKGVTTEAEKLAKQHDVQIINLEKLDKDLREDV